MEQIITFIINIGSFFSSEVLVFLISAMPILELRGGLLAASLLEIPYTKALLICVLGNILPIPFILLLFNKILALMEKWKVTQKLALWLRKKASDNKVKIDKYGFPGLALFVGIPLPGTGAWTGSLVATVFKMDIKKSVLFIFIGLIIAVAIMTVISYIILPYLMGRTVNII